MRFAAIADWADADDYDVDFMCAELGVSRSGYYAWRHRAPSARARDDISLTSLIRDLFAGARENPGVRRMRAMLAAAGRLVSHRKVHRLGAPPACGGMRAAGLVGRHPRRFRTATTGGDRPAPAPDLIGRDFTASGPDLKWCGDITYIQTWNGWAYLATVIDLYSRKVVGFAIADHMHTSLITKVFSARLRWSALDDEGLVAGPRGARGGKIVTTTI